MSDKELKSKIENCIKSFANTPLYQASIELFNTLGYNTDIQSPLTDKNYNGFKEYFLQTDSNFNEEKAFVKEWRCIDLLFQITEKQISNKLELFDTRQVDNTIIESYLFFCIELTNKEYSRTKLAQITREINKVFRMPVLIVFKYDKSITLSVINRRVNENDKSKDVLEKVTVIKDISTTKPHRAHIEILYDLSFYELSRVYQFTNFVELHNAWQKTLDTKELNKKFYKELSNWYFWAIDIVEFPDGEEKKRKERNATSLIRLITRLIFVWFLKERGLVSDDIFNKIIIKDKIDLGDNNDSFYYKAILQNLFFATINCKTSERRFREKITGDKNQDNMNKKVYRYQDRFKDPEAFKKDYFDSIPYLNGGLFDCLDRKEKLNDKIEKILVDGFSDRDDNVLSVPNKLFFAEYEDNIEVDLSAIYDDNKKKNLKMRGIVQILNSYKFTVTENTLLEEDVALDPELLGSVFENLASITPKLKLLLESRRGAFIHQKRLLNIW